MEWADYKNRQVVITGCFSGIGRATAGLLSEQGAIVHGLDLQTPDLELASFRTADFRDPKAIDRALESIADPVHCPFNCAGVAPSRPDSEVLSVNFFATRYLTRRLAERMEAGGAIASVGSIGGYGWGRHLAELNGFLELESLTEGLAWFEKYGQFAPNAYSFSKQAIAAWTAQVSATLIKHGIRINCIAPGSVQTPMLDEIEREMPAANVDSVIEPIGRRSAAEEQAWALLMLNSDRASYINGVELPVDGGAAAAMTSASKGTFDRLRKQDSGPR